MSDRVEYLSFLLDQAASLLEAGLSGRTDVERTQYLISLIRKEIQSDEQ